MRIIEGTTEFHIGQKSGVAIGKFDGLHIGHHKLLNRLLEQKADGLTAVVFTFDTSAAAFFTNSRVKELTTREEKRRYFEQLGIDILIEFPLNQETAGIPAELFVEKILVEQMRMSYIAAGADLSFGAGGAGSARLLQQLQGRYDYQMEMIDKVQYAGREVSSTYVRQEVEKGDMELAARLLGRAYSMSGTVVTGNQIGRKLGMPTVNLIPEVDKLLPPLGVYLSKVYRENGVCYNGITNIGYKPTVTSEHRLGVETYLYDFDQDVYGSRIRVEFLQHRRPEMKFAGLEELKHQLQLDIADGAAYFQIE